MIYSWLLALTLLLSIVSPPISNTIEDIVDINARDSDDGINLSLPGGAVDQDALRKSQERGPQDLQTIYVGRDRVFAKDNNNVYCLYLQQEGMVLDSLEERTLSNIDPGSVSLVDSNHLKDQKFVYRIICPHEGNPYAEAFSVEDIDTFHPAPMQTIGNIFIYVDKYFVYMSLPQAYEIVKFESIDRKSFQSIGYGAKRPVELPEGRIAMSKAFYFVDRHDAYKLERGVLSELDTNPRLFEIEEYEAHSEKK